MAIDPALLRAPAEGRVLLLPPTRRDAEAIVKVLGQEGLACVVCADMPALGAALAEGAGALLVSEEALVADSAGLAAAVARQPVWSDLPTLVLSRSGQESPKLSALMPQLGNASVVERPVRITTLLSLVHSALRARQRQYQVRAHLALQEQAAKELRQSEERLALAVRTARLGVWSLERDTMAMTSSATLRENYGAPPHEPFGYQDLWRAVHPDDTQRVRATMLQAIAEKADYETEYRVLRPNGSQHWLLSRGQPQFDAGGRLVRMHGVSLDITDRRRIEEERQNLLEAERAARSAAERAARMKDEFLATLSHELRTPLNAIMGWAQLLLMRAPEPARLAEGLSVIDRCARAQTQIIEDLLDMSRIVSGKVRLTVRPMALAEAVESALDTVRPAAEAKGVRLLGSVGVGAGDGTGSLVSGDASRLQQVFWNLLSNAVKFTPRGSQVQVRVVGGPAHLEVQVQDAGEGIAAEFLPYVFDRFRQADASSTRQHGGLGLGLAIVKQLVELHGGCVEAASDGPGRGASFTVRLPRLGADTPACDEPTPATEPARERPAAAGRLHDLAGVRVLVVDDEADSRGLARRLLEDCDAVVTTAGTAAEAYGLLRSTRPQVLVSDIGMPGEDGYSLIRRVRALPAADGGETPALALTAYARAEDRAQALAAGFQAHVTKPLEAGALVALVAGLAEGGRKPPVADPKRRPAAALVP